MNDIIQFVLFFLTALAWIVLAMNALLWSVVFFQILTSTRRYRIVLGWLDLWSVIALAWVIAYYQVF